ncbi:MAG: AbrB/MazE/SpoVT family DNA-binding domain-containing protein [Spirochaetaceae bacterium]|nr:MAG: AbrB/MazE/SpoVT family DNA-binding domain-containing protein [Spirochaetaceae bacterium]
MKVSVVPIGNSKGIRLPKAILEQLNISDQLELEVENKQIILRPINKAPRSGWEEALQQMNKNQEDKLLIPETGTEEAFEWEW